MAGSGEKFGKHWGCHEHERDQQQIPYIEGPIRAIVSFCIVSIGVSFIEISPFSPMHTLPLSFVLYFRLARNNDLLEIPRQLRHLLYLLKT